MYVPTVPQLGYVNYSYAKTVGVFTRKKQYFVEKVKMEELATVGISYVRPDGLYANAATWVTTENALRNEHGYNKRVRY